MVAAVTCNNFNNLVIPQDQAYAQQGQEYFEAANHKGAWLCFNEAIKINPNMWVYYYMRGACNTYMGYYQTALSDYNKALSLTTTNEEKASCHWDLAILYSMMCDENTSKNHLIMSARFGNNDAQNFCKQNGIPY